LVYGGLNNIEMELTGGSPDGKSSTGAENCLDSPQDVVGSLEGGGEIRVRIIPKRR